MAAKLRSFVAPAGAAEPGRWAAARGVIGSATVTFMGKSKPRRPEQDSQFELHRAISKGDISWVQQVLELDADPNRKLSVNLTITSGWIPLHYAVDSDNAEIAALLLDAGADIDAKDDLGETPLRMAVETSHTYQVFAPHVARLLVERGADVNVQGSWNSILHEALRSRKADSDDKELIRLLKAAGATIWSSS